MAANGWAREVLAPDAGAPETGHTCCSVLGCRRAGGPLAGRCVCDLALATREPPPELRVRAPAGTLWVSARRLTSDPPRVVLALRQEHRDTVRPAARGRLRLYVLGRLRVECDGVSLAGDWIDQRAGQLLRCLVCQRYQTVPTEVLAEAIWRQAGPRAPNTVRQFIHTLRAQLEPGRARHSASSFVVSRHGGYALHRESVWIDADEFETDVRAGLRSVGEHDRARARVLLERACAAYAGDFLADHPYAEWAMPERERLRALLASALRSLADLSREDPETACEYLERRAQLEPFDNDAARELIFAWMRLGRRSRAMRYYQAFQVRLAREFGERPDFLLHDVLASSPVRAVVG